MAHSTQPTSSTLRKEMKVNKVFGMPAKQEAKKMTPMQVAKRKRSMISNAANKVMGGKYSK